MPRIHRQSNWCFTLNNYSDDEHSQLIGKLESECAYYIVGKEVGDSGTPHLQGFFQLRRRRDFKHVRDFIGARAHLEPARGTAKQNRSYCSKGGSFAEGGTVPEEGRRCNNGASSRDTVAASFASAYNSGAGGLAEFANSHPGTWYFSGHHMLRNAQLLVQPVHRPDISVKWIYGEPGTGKSRAAHAELPEAYLKEPRTKWWNGYNFEKSVILDDFGPGGIDINHLLRWFDRYKCLVETKGGMLALHADTFIVTSNFHPEQVYTSFEVPHPQLPALLRRIKLVKM